MDDLLKDAIADAKAVRETAIANAKLALEEAFKRGIKPFFIPVIVLISSLVIFCLFLLFLYYFRVKI